VKFISRCFIDPKNPASVPRIGSLPTFSILSAFFRCVGSFACGTAKKLPFRRPQAVNLAPLQRLSSVAVGVGAVASRSLLRSALAMEGRKVPRAPELSAESPSSSSAGFKTYSAAASGSASADRISLVSGHLSPSSYTATPPAQASVSSQARRLSTSTATMSSQPEHATLLIPGPIEFDDEVLKSMGHYRYATIRLGSRSRDVIDNISLANTCHTVRATSAPASSTPSARPSP
jgi:hypothetical protein